MKQQEANQAQGLKDAFHLFNQVSEQLTSTYQYLENRIGQLNDELAAARSERLAQLAEKECLANRLERLLEALPAGVVVIDGDGVVHQCNSRAVELMGEPLTGIQWRSIVERSFVSLAGGDEAVLKDGRIVSISTNPLGEEPGQILLLKDVTETRALQEMLNRHQRLSAIGEMLASLAHQIRTPLASSLLYLSHLKQSHMEPQDHQRCVEKILSRLRHLDHLVNDMMVFAKGGRCGTEVIDCSSLLRELQQVMEPHLVANHCVLEIEGDTHAIKLQGNHDALLSVLQNLVQNSIQACMTHNQSTDKASQTGRIKVTACIDTEKKGIKTMVMLIKDNGAGIPDELQKRVFEPFFTTKSQGTGLGLTVVQAVIHAHNGTLWIDSKPGKGATVGIRLPVLDDAESAN